MPLCTTGLKALFDPSQPHKDSPDCPVTNISLTKRQRLQGDQLSVFLNKFIKPLGIGS